MNLLPKSSQDFSKTDYWNTFFKKRGTKAFEWYGEYAELAEHLHRYIKPNDDVFVVGCGNSTLSGDLYDAGFKRLTNIDTSQVVIKQMTAANERKRPGMTFIQMDALNTTFDSDRFNVVLDKGTLDALMTDDSEETQRRIDKYFGEIARVLKLTGRYICISLLQEHIVRKVVAFFANENWMVKIVRCHAAEGRNAEDGKSDGMVMPVFMVVVTKFKKLPHLLLELCLHDDKAVRVNTTNEILDAIKNVQNAAVITNGLTKQTLEDSEEISLDLTKPNDEAIRYTLYVQDQMNLKKNGPFAAFIVPQGRETDWIFSTKEGRRKLLQNAGFGRLAIIILHRDQIYDSQDSIKSELSESIRNLAPKGVQSHIPFLSLGQDVGKREIIHRGTSEFSGDFVVEEIVGEDNFPYRRLIFLNNQFVVQSESRLKTIKNKKGKKTIVIDYGYLACSHHIYMSIGVQMAIQNLNSQDEAEIALIGLGGGGLCSFLQKCFDRLKITAVDIDKQILKVAEMFFGLTCDEKLKVLIEDGIDFLKKSKNNGTRYNIIMFDVDSKDPTVGISCPPIQFVQNDMLQIVNTSLKEEGYFILNLVCRDDALKKDTMNTLNATFKNVATYKIDQEVNEIIFCTNKVSVKWKEDFRTASNMLNTNVKNHQFQKESLVDVEEFLKMLKFNNTRS